MLREADLLEAIAAQPADAVAWLALADWLEEHGQDDRAALVRRREWLRSADIDDPRRPDAEREVGRLLLAGVRPSIPLRTFPLAGKVTLILALIPPGHCWMGAATDEIHKFSDEQPRHCVTLTKAFWIGVTSVTCAQWYAVNSDQTAAGPKPSHPMHSVLWAEAGKFCKRLGRLVGDRFRLPTEAEWEYACRAGTTGVTYLGDPESLDAAAWHTDNSNDHTHPVGKKKPNAWGLYDMLGNVWDWCADGERSYTPRPVTDPVGPDGPRRAVKGGAWRSSPGRCRPASRYSEEPRRRTDDQGFRVVMEWQA